MFYTYVLISVDKSHRYIGHTQNLSNRISYHNSGKVRSTKAFRPWKIVYFEEFNTREEAIQHEKYLKSDIGRDWLKDKI
ncbi:MAG: GIY-YIG nuclease family protein [Candidatus Marinimicrobia bacterium]|nr:GIY-YIG nuclease family protein [Candidatus Neomarinimicrobiota bacterium]